MGNVINNVGSTLGFYGIGFLAVFLIFFIIKNGINYLKDGGKVTSLQQIVIYVVAFILIAGIIFTIANGWQGLAKSGEGLGNTIVKSSTDLSNELLNGGAK